MSPTLHMVKGQMLELRLIFELYDSNICEMIKKNMKDFMLLFVLQIKFGSKNSEQCPPDFFLLTMGVPKASL